MRLDTPVSVNSETMAMNFYRITLDQNVAFHQGEVDV